MTPQQLQIICPTLDSSHCQTLAPVLTDVMRDAGTTTVTRAAAFMGQLCAESGEFRYTREVWSPLAVPNQARYERDTKAAWPPTEHDPRNRLAYDLGNSEPGDGYMFRGWGPLQITGRQNTRNASLAMFGDERLTRTPNLLDDPAMGLRGAAWFWRTRGLNGKADMIDYERVTKAINGGLSWHSRRVAYYHRALEVLGRVTDLP